MEAAGIDACGELGEYHTVVTDGPLFASGIMLQLGERRTRNEYSFLDTAEQDTAAQAPRPA
jgi:diphthamide synthase (EF-2-diphthine--ammonia ligase)